MRLTLSWLTQVFQISLINSLKGLFLLDHRLFSSWNGVTVCQWIIFLKEHSYITCSAITRSDAYQLCTHPALSTWCSYSGELIQYFVLLNDNTLRPMTTWQGRPTESGFWCEWSHSTCVDDVVTCFPDVNNEFVSLLTHMSSQRSGVLTAWTDVQSCPVFLAWSFQGQGARTVETYTTLTFPGFLTFTACIHCNWLCKHYI